MQVKLYKNFPITSMENQVFYYNEQKRDDDFDKYTGLTLKEYSQNDKTKKIIHIDKSYVDLNHFNYGVIIDDNMRYYIFITAIEWKSNGTAILHYQYDNWQTYCYRVEFEESYVEREHVYDDRYGRNIIDEGLPVDEYKIYKYNGSTSVDVLGNEIDGVMYCCTMVDTRDVISTQHNVQEPLPATCQPSRNEVSTMIIYSDDPEMIKWYIARAVGQNKLDSIGGFYAVPKIAFNHIPHNTGYDWNTGELEINYVGVNNNLPEMLSKTYQLPHIFTDNTGEDFEPLNAKTLTYPYCFCNYSNSNGSNLIGQFELSDNPGFVTFEYYFPIIEGNVSFGYLKNYDGVGKNFDKSLQGQTNIELPFVSNTFSAYMSANQNSIANQYDVIERNKVQKDMNTGINFASGLIGNALSGNVGGVVSSIVGAGQSLINTDIETYNQRANIDSALRDVQSKGNISHGSFIGVGNITCGQNGFKSMIMHVPVENMRMIDDYFNMFGYKVNAIKIPQFDSRPYYNYIKTSGVNLIAEIPLDAIKDIKAMFDNGTTIWHNIGYMYKYSELKQKNLAPYRD